MLVFEPISESESVDFHAVASECSDGCTSISAIEFNISSVVWVFNVVAFNSIVFDAVTDVSFFCTLNI